MRDHIKTEKQDNTEPYHVKSKGSANFGETSKSNFYETTRKNKENWNLKFQTNTSRNFSNSSYSKSKEKDN